MRVLLRTKTRGKELTCEKCRKSIEKGQKYYKWSFRYRGTHTQHESCGYPKPSQLTQSKMSGVYAAVEFCEESISSSDNKDDIVSALNDCAQSIQDVRDEYQEAIDNAPQGLQDAGGPGGQWQEKIDQLEEFQSALEEASSDIEGESFEFDGNEDEAPSAGEQEKEWLNELKEKANEALGSLSV